MCTFIILVLIHVARQAKVAELNTFRRSNQDVSHCYVSAAQPEQKQHQFNFKSYI